MPDFHLEDKTDGLVCGLDEVGRGPLAGPVVAACVLIPDKIRQYSFINELNDSKKIAPKKRERLFEDICAHCHYGVAEIDVETIDRINILQASLLAMRTAYKNMKVPVDLALVDGNKAPTLNCNSQTVVKGDSVSATIAAASIVAKVTRDRLMKELDAQYPGYGWITNSGYGSKAHIEALDSIGITPHHRKSFAPVRNRIEKMRLESA